MEPVIDYPFSFFDGASTNLNGGVGVELLISQDHYFSIKMGFGQSTNTISELLALWALLMVIKHLGIPLLTIYGDSLVIISWVNRLASLNAPHLSHQCDDILSLLQHVPPVTIKHIYREHNQQANGLSKQALLLDPGFGNFTESLDGMIIDRGNYQFFQLVPGFCPFSFLWYIYLSMLELEPS